MPRKPTGKPNGRPRGSRTKSKLPTIAPAPATPKHSAEPAEVVGAGPDGTASLLAYHHARLRDLAEDIRRARATNALPADLAKFLTAEGLALKAIGELTGATKLTEAKVLASDVWKAIELRLMTALAPYPDATAAVIAAAYNEGSESTTESPS